MKKTKIPIAHLDAIAQSILSRINKRDPRISGKTLTPSQVWEYAKAYLDYANGEKWTQSEVIKGGVKAGTVVNVPVSNPLTLQSFRVFAGIGARTFARYLGDYVDAKDVEGSHEPYYEIANFIRDIIQADQIEGAMVGAYDPRITATVVGLAEKKEVTGKDGAPISIDQIKGMIIK